MFACWKVIFKREGDLNWIFHVIFTNKHAGEDFSTEYRKGFIRRWNIFKILFPKDSTLIKHYVGT